MMLFRNDVFELSTGDRYRILSIDTEHDSCHVIHLTDERSLPIRRSYSDLNGKVASGDLRSVEGNIVQYSHKPSDAELRRRDKLWAMIEPLISHKDIFDKNVRGQLVSQHSQALDCSKTTLYDKLRRYWVGGQTRDALLPHYYNCGHTSDGTTRNRGRPPSNDRYAVFNMGPADIDNIKEIINRYYLKKDYLTVADAYRELVKSHYTYLDGNSNICVRPVGERPTPRQVRRVLAKLFPLEHVLRRKLGDGEFERNHAPKLGQAIHDCVGVGDVYEIDATIADLLLVSQFDRSKIIGKPTLYLIIDRWSDLIVGFYVGLESASWAAAMEAILSIAESKEEICCRYGVPYDPADWPADGVLPHKFFADRGEMLSENSNRICDGIESVVVNARSRRPTKKSYVECGFKTIQTKIAAKASGYTPPQQSKKRNGKHYDQDACYTLHEFTAIVLRQIIAHNRSVKNRHPLSPQAILKGVSPIPVELWNYDAATRAGSLSRFSEPYLRFKLLPRDVATVTREGIFFRGCYYTCDAAIREGWFLKKHRSRIEISYDSRLVDHIYIHITRSPGEYITADLLKKSRDYSGLSFAEVATYEQLAKRTREQADEVNVQEQVRFMAGVDVISKRAHDEMKASTKGKSRSSRKKDIADDRAIEARQNRMHDGSRLIQTESADALQESSAKHETADSRHSPLDEYLMNKIKELTNV